MARQAPIQVQVNGANHMVDVDVKSAKTIVFINGQFALEFKNNSLSWAIGVNEDIPVVIDNMQFIVAVRKGKARLVANGLYIDNNQSHEVVQPAPGWLLVFIILCLIEAAFSIYLGGFLGIAIGLIGIAGCSAIGRSKMTNGAKIGLCIAAVAAVYIVWYLWITFALLLL